MANDDPFHGLYDHNLRGEHLLTYWTTLMLTYEAVNNYQHDCAAYHQEKKYHMNMTNLNLRNFFRAKAFEYELTNWFCSGYTGDYEFNNLIRSRDIPDMQTYLVQMLERHVEIFFDRYRQHLRIDSQLHGEEVRQWLQSLLMVMPQDTSFYCLHCKNKVDDIMVINQQQQQHVCPRCGGWYLFEWDPVYLPLEPTNWGLVCRRLWPSNNIDGPQPSLRDLEEADNGDLEEAEDLQCVICENDYTLPGKVPVKLPCAHIFHSECITDWFKAKPDRRHCPKCRRLLPTVDRLFNIELRLIAMEENYPPPFLLP